MPENKKETSFNLEWKDKTTFQIKVVIPREKIKDEYESALNQIVKSAKVNGFRQGKAPREKVEEKVGKDAVYKELMQKLIPQVYQEAITKHEVRPITDPKINLESAKEDEDWTLTITSCVAPEIQLGDYKAEIKKISPAAKIWVPGKDKKEEPKEGKEKRLNEILAKLANLAKAEVPQFLIETEVQKKLVALIDQLQKTGLSIDQYLNTKGQTIEELRTELSKQIAVDWKLELLLEKIADEEKITVSTEEIRDFLSKQQVKNTDQVNFYLLASLLRRQKTLDYLLSL